MSCERWGVFVMRYPRVTRSTAWGEDIFPLNALFDYEKEKTAMGSIIIYKKINLERNGRFRTNVSKKK